MLEVEDSATALRAAAEEGKARDPASRLTAFACYAEAYELLRSSPGVDSRQE